MWLPAGYYLGLFGLTTFWFDWDSYSFENLFMHFGFGEVFHGFFMLWVGSETLDHF